MRVVKQFEPIKLTDITKIPMAKEVLDKGLEILKNDKWYVAFGTALGLYRDKKFIRGDSDFDIAIITETTKRNLEIIKDFKTKFKLLRTVEYQGRPMQYAFVDDSTIIYDLVFFYEDYSDTHYITIADEQTFRDKKDVIGKRQLIKTKYGELYFPENIDQYLTDRYGDWKTPQDIKSIKDGEL